MSLMLAISGRALFKPLPNDYGTAVIVETTICRPAGIKMAAVYIIRIYVSQSVYLQYFQIRSQN